MKLIIKIKERIEDRQFDRRARNEAIVNLFWCGWPAWQIAALLGIPESTVRFVLRDLLK